MSVEQGVPPAAQPDQLAALLDASGPFRDAYLAACLGRMQDAVGAACCFGLAQHWLYMFALEAHCSVCGICLPCCVACRVCLLQRSLTSWQRCWMHQAPSGTLTSQHAWGACRMQLAPHSLAVRECCRAQQMCRSASGEAMWWCMFIAVWCKAMHCLAPGPQGVSSVVSTETTHLWRPSHACYLSQHMRLCWVSSRQPSP
jgi:hypothetical protein